MQAPAQVREELGVAPRIGQLLRRMERLERAAQLRREIVVPLVAGQIADFPFGSQLGEDRLRRPRSRLGVGGLPGPVQHHDEVPRRLGLELRPPVRLRPPDHLAQGPLGGRHLAFGRQHRRRDPQVLGLADGIGQAAADLLNLFQLAPCQLQLTADHADLHPSPER